MLAQKLPPQLSPARSKKNIIVYIIILLLSVLCIHHFVDHQAWTIATLPFNWHPYADEFVLPERQDTLDTFDVTFSIYADYVLSSAPHDDVVPPILHHIALGNSTPEWNTQWTAARQSCLNWHPGWEAHLWTDEKAEQFISDRFPDMLSTWKGYRYPVQRVDALRYMVLYEYGGVILDMDLKCKRALGPLRQFNFVAPAAKPTGFSIGFMMASKRLPFVKDLVDNLPKYDKQWLELPYATVMFSSGCHYASTIYVEQQNRTGLRILPGPLHSLSGRVSTPLFDHLGSSSWHTSDALFIRQFGKTVLVVLAFLLGVVLAVYLKSTKSITRRLKLI